MLDYINLDFNFNTQILFLQRQILFIVLHIKLKFINDHHEKTWLCHMRTTKAQISLRRLICAFVVRCLDSIISILAKSNISRL